MTSKKIENNMVASVHYRGTLTDTGEEFDNSHGNEPLTYLVGSGQMIPGFEKALMGVEVGEKKTFNLEADEAYGPMNPEGVQEVPKDQFPPEIEVGMVFAAQMPDGNSLPIRVTKIEESTVTIDFNHQLAGQRLTFEVEVMDVRAASEDEISHGHAHGPGGHQH